MEPTDIGYRRQIRRVRFAGAGAHAFEHHAAVHLPLRIPPRRLRPCAIYLSNRTGDIGGLRIDLQQARARRRCRVCRERTRRRAHAPDRRSAEAGEYPRAVALAAGETATQTGALASAPGDCTDGRLGKEVAVVRMAQLPNKCAGILAVPLPGERPGANYCMKNGSQPGEVARRRQAGLSARNPTAAPPCRCGPGRARNSGRCHR